MTNILVEMVPRGKKWGGLPGLLVRSSMVYLNQPTLLGV